MPPSLRRLQPVGQPAAPVTPRVKIPRAQRPGYQAKHPLIGTTPAAPAPAAPAAPSADTTNTLFPNTRMFEPENYGGSPLYKFQVQQGQQQLGRSLAARGLTNSGHGIEEELNIPLRAAAQDTDRMTRVASENAGRLFDTQNNEALRREREGNNQWNRQYQIAELLSRQNPFNAAVDGLNSSAGLGQDALVSGANHLRDSYGRVQGPGQQMPLPVRDNSGSSLEGLHNDKNRNTELITLFNQLFQNFLPKEQALGKATT